MACLHSGAEWGRSNPAAHLRDTSRDWRLHRFDFAGGSSGRDDIYALGDCARGSNEATPGVFDPPTCQHALRQSRRLAKNLCGKAKPYGYRSLGQAATLGRDKGIAAVLGLRLRGRLGALFTRAYHLHQLPLMSRRLRVLADGLLTLVFRRDFAELGTTELREPRGPQPAV